jgi:hypothetical protein
MKTRAFLVPLVRASMTSNGNPTRALRRAALGVITLSIVGCASVPNTRTIEYALPKAVTKLTVVQTLGCAADPSQATNILSAISVTPNTTYLADDNPEARGQIALSTFDHNLSDADLDVTLSDDGQLKTINATTTGSGTAVIKAAIALGALAATIGGGEGEKNASQEKIKAVCTAIKNISSAEKSPGDSPAPKVAATPPPNPGHMPPPGGDNPPQNDDNSKTKSPNLITLTFEVSVAYVGDASDITGITADASTPDNKSVAEHRTCAGSVHIPADANTLSILEAEHDLGAMAGSFCVTLVSHSVHANPGKRDETSHDSDPPAHFTSIKLAHVFSTTLAVSGLTGVTDAHGVPETVEYWRGRVNVPLSSATYTVLVPTGTPFGAEKFALQLADDGTVTELHYGASGGANDVATAAQAVVKALPTTATKASDLSAQSDLIYEQQRLLTCKLTPKSCQPK